MIVEWYQLYITCNFLTIQLRPILISLNQSSFILRLCYYSLRYYLRYVQSLLSFFCCYVIQGKDQSNCLSSRGFQSSYLRVVAHRLSKVSIWNLFMLLKVSKTMKFIGGLGNTKLALASFISISNRLTFYLGISAIMISFLSSFFTSLSLLIGVSFGNQPQMIGFYMISRFSSTLYSLSSFLLYYFGMNYFYYRLCSSFLGQNSNFLGGSSWNLRLFGGGGGGKGGLMIPNLGFGQNLSSLCLCTFSRYLPLLSAYASLQQRQFFCSLQSSFSLKLYLNFDYSFSFLSALSQKLLLLFSFLLGYVNLLQLYRLLSRLCLGDFEILFDDELTYLLDYNLFYRFYYFLYYWQSLSRSSLRVKLYLVTFFLSSFLL